MAAALPEVRPGTPWSAESSSSSRARARLRLRRDDGVPAIVEIERCAAGRLREAYPVGEHDVEIWVATDSQASGDLLRLMVQAVQAADPRCRRVVLAVPADDDSALSTAREAGFRHAVEVDLPGAPGLNLLVAEP